MAGPISHTIFAKKALSSLLTGKDEKQFIIGNLFPDIRYLKVISRDVTHFSNVTLSDVQGENDPFMAGVLFHSLIDEARERFVVAKNAYKHLPDSHLSTVALKVCEDRKLYSYTDKWSLYTGYLKDVLPQEKDFDVPEEKLIQWHRMHVDFLSNPSIEENKQFFSALGFTQNQITELFTLIALIDSNQTVATYVDELYSNIESIVKANFSV